MPRLLDVPGALIRRVAATVKNVERDTGRTTRRKAPPTRPVDRGVRVEYSPVLDGDPDPGEVVWTWVPYDDDPPLGKDRPVLIIGRHGVDLSGVALTTKHRGSGDHVEIGTGAWDARGRPSYAKVDRLLDIQPSEVRREGAVLGRRRFDAVIEAVDRLHDVAR
jgi:PemK-like, MazF-like toxin of type II toxin-antitoxin system